MQSISPTKSGPAAYKLNLIEANVEEDAFVTSNSWSCTKIYVSDSN